MFRVVYVWEFYQSPHGATRRMVSDIFDSFDEAVEHALDEWKRLTLFDSLTPDEHKKQVETVARGALKEFPNRIKITDGSSTTNGQSSCYIGVERLAQYE